MDFSLDIICVNCHSPFNEIEQNFCGICGQKRKSSGHITFKSNRKPVFRSSSNVKRVHPLSPIISSLPTHNIISKRKTQLLDISPLPTLYQCPDHFQTSRQIQFKKIPSLNNNTFTSSSSVVDTSSNFDHLSTNNIIKEKKENEKTNTTCVSSYSNSDLFPDSFKDIVPIESKLPKIPKKKNSTLSSAPFIKVSAIRSQRYTGKFKQKNRRNNSSRKFEKFEKIKKWKIDNVENKRKIQMGWYCDLLDDDSLENSVIIEQESISKKKKHDDDKIICDTQKPSRNSVSSCNLQKILTDNFGFDSFLDGQIEAIERILSHKSTLLILSTGAGKSLCYQIPAFIIPGLTLVICPLISLMQDQSSRLPSCLTGAVWSSSQTPEQIISLRKKIKANAINVLFISPERLFSPSFQELIRTLPPPGISFVCVDEAHCLSEWSHNFRPSYLRLREVFNNLNISVFFLALTATATVLTAREICCSLDIPEEGVIRITPVRTNLQISISEDLLRNENKKINIHSPLLTLLKSPPFKGLSSIIIYVTRKDNAEKISTFLISHGFSSLYYHASLNNKQRYKVQQSFMNGTIQIVVATVAFGMGLDKKNVRGIIHYNIPENLEHYVQQIGRAGRDGLISYCHAFFSKTDFKRMNTLNHSNNLFYDSFDQIYSLLYKTSKNQNNIFPRYVTLHIEPTEFNLDIRQEILDTVFAQMDLYSSNHLHQPFLSYQPNVHGLVSIALYQQSFEKLSTYNQVINALNTLSLNIPNSSGHYTFSLTAVANLLQRTLTDIQYELLKLQSEGKISITWKNYSYCILLHRDLSNEEKDKLILYLQKKYHLQLSTQLKKLDITSNVFSKALRDTFYQNNTMHKMLTSYFLSPDPFESLMTNPLNKEKDYQSITSILDQYPCIQSDIRKLIFDDDLKTFPSATSITRILFGISSPKFPANEWYSNRLWGKYSGCDFKLVHNLVDRIFTSEKKKENVEIDKDI